jgi:hypothetical protein
MPWKFLTYCISFGILKFEFLDKVLEEKLKRK